jgi:hypothetical protein
MIKMYGMLAYWCGCLAVVLLLVGLVGVPATLAWADGGGGGAGPLDGGSQCPANPNFPYGCVNPGKICYTFGNQSLCAPPKGAPKACDCPYVSSPPP